MPSDQKFWVTPLSRGFSVFSGAAVVRENLNLFCRPSFGHVSCEPVALEVGARQGGPRTPSAWNQLVAPLVDELLLLWSRRGPAVSWAPVWNDVSILVWVDNIFLTTDSAAEAARRSCEVASVFKSRKLLLNESSLEFLPSRAAEKDRTPVVLEGGEMFRWVDTIQVLGCFLDGSGSTETLAEGRLVHGRKMFKKLRPFLCCPQIPQEERVGGFYSTVGTSVLWGAGCWSSWSPSIKTGGSAASLGGREERKVCGTEWVAWLRKTKRAAHNSQSSVQVVASCTVPQGAGGYSRLGWTQGHSWRHPKHYWVRGFEGALVRICGTGWKDLAGAKRQVWMSQRQEFVAEAVRIWSGPRLARPHGKQDIACAIPHDL